MRAALIAIICTIVSVRAHASPNQELEQARQSIRAKAWQSATPILKDLLYPQPRLASTSDLVEAHVLLGVSHFETGRRDEARSEFEVVLSLQPDKTLETLLFSSGAVRLFDETRADLDARAKVNAELRKIEEERERLRKFRESLVVYETRPYYVNFVPFGAGQFQNGRRGKGILFATTQGLTGGASLGIFIYLWRKYGLVAKVPTLTEGAQVRQLQQIEIAAAIAFYGFYAWGVVDSLVYYRPRLKIEGDDSLLPADLQNRPVKPPSPTKKTSLRDRLRIGPVLLPSGAGIGLSLEN